jgi:predicted membrane protein
MARRDRGRVTRGGIVVGIKMGKGTVNPRWSLIWGAFIALIGLVFLLDNMNIFPASRLYRFWPLILIIAGIINLTCRSARFFGIMLLIAGVLFQLSELGVAHFGWGQLWPIAIIAVGLLVMWSSYEARHRLAASHSSAATGDATSGDATSPDPSDPNVPDLRNTLNEVAIFGGVERRIVTQDFRGGTINAIFGGVELDLSHAAMQQPQAELEVNAIFGGVELRVPDTWQVVSSGQAIFGGYDDKTGSADLPEGDPRRKLLVLTGSVVFGGVEIKS